VGQHHWYPFSRGGRSASASTFYAAGRLTFAGA